MQPTLTAHPPTPLGHSPPYAAMDTGVLKNCPQFGLVPEGYGGCRAEQWLVSLLRMLDDGLHGQCRSVEVDAAAIWMSEKQTLVRSVVAIAIRPLGLARLPATLSRQLELPPPVAAQVLAFIIELRAVRRNVAKLIAVEALRHPAVRALDGHMPTLTARITAAVEPLGHGCVALRPTQPLRPTPKVVETSVVSAGGGLPEDPEFDES